jgi:(R,R)-butanediol dehydrogenase / meso-butanediol dehydrogenase / diacetyl reductase
MRAARYYEPGDVRIEEVPEPTAGPGEVKLRVAYNGICGSDLHEYYDGARAVPMAPHPLTGISAPVILGHEASGFVVDAGSGVEDLEAGELVAIEPTKNCGVCPSCLRGAYNLCDRLALHGYSTGGGGLSDFTVVSRAMVHRVPRGFSAEQAALVEPLAVAYHALRRAEVHPGQTVAVHGGGPVGIGVLLSLRAAGIDDVIVVEPAAPRQRAASSLGALVVDPALGDPAAQIRSLTNGAGVPVAFETAGAPTSFLAAVAATAKQGTVVAVSSSRAPVVAPLGALIANEITVRTSYTYCGDFPVVIEAIARGAYPTADWVSTIELEDLISGFESLRHGERIKLLVRLGGSTTESLGH